MTEDEAKQKWCPFVRLIPSDTDGTSTIGVPVGYNRMALTGGNPPTISSATCIGSACMAWRCGTRGAVKHRETNVVRFLMPGDTYNPAEEIHFQADDQNNGYCGLAGTP